MAGTKRAENRAAMTAEILRLGREHLSTQGAAGLSLRAIAREMGVVSSAVYRYVPSRDDLLTLLVVEGYTDLADAVEAAMTGDDPHERLRRGAVAMRRWAVDDPPRWALLYGSPVPGYAAPAERTVEPGTRVVGALLRTIADAERTGLLRDDLPAPDRKLDLSGVATEFGLDMPSSTIQAATLLWATIVGAISLEVFGQYGPDSFNAPEALFAGQIDLVLTTLFA
ncbi:putative TetR family transcriptional regulator [Gordonia araii NBRC 100433]|uniref:Putative TetR family transcriptional regulator n=1 Tax=Gordonia araii NBRC 100433 TaxID=1073574 RepID=G7GZC2_9ACTN|nr:TetR/AcrR family transcriptional regulator [Gordonia araii]NNG98659.1 TetR/AcrR family transcriptional regulator [Gordonia araii NBRC 100433]GAB08947.1 putative TetR family transcriptional regulator [Gordonia araii NBRC 100433]